MRPLRAKRRVVAVARVDDGVVAVNVEHSAGDVTEELLETTWFPGLSDPTREQGRSSVGNTSAPERSCPRQTEIYLMDCPRLAAREQSDPGSHRPSVGWRSAADLSPPSAVDDRGLFAFGDWSGEPLLITDPLQPLQRLVETGAQPRTRREGGG